MECSPNDSVLLLTKNVSQSSGGHQYVVCAGVIPAARHQLSFCKKLTNHLGAIKLCIGRYHLTRAAA
jgi:hypothetical protein